VNNGSQLKNDSSKCDLLAEVAKWGQLLSISGAYKIIDATRESAL